MPGVLIIVFIMLISSFFICMKMDRENPKEAVVNSETQLEGSLNTAFLNSEDTPDSVSDFQAEPARLGFSSESGSRAVTLGKSGFSPIQGNNSTLFKFTVTYYNGDGEEAVDHDIIIDSIAYEMDHVSGDPVSGSVYEYQTKLSMGTHSYRFSFPPVFLPENGVNNGPVVNRPSSLFWTLEENYENNGVFPSSGVSVDDFLFRISYTDLDNDDPRLGPGYINVLLDGDSHSMETVDELFSDGSIFSFNLSDLSPGEHEYHFECFDGHYMVRFPDTGEMSLPVINTRPELIVPRLPSMGGNTIAGTVHPDIANVTDKFTFQVIYLDIDDHPPSTQPGSRGVYIDNVFYNMVPQEGIGIYYDENYANGEIFEVKLSLPLGDSHSYYFEFTDELLGTNYTDLFEGPVVVEGFPDLRIAKENKMLLIKGGPISIDHSDWYDILISAVIENPSDFSVNEPFYVSFEIFHANRQTGVFYLEGVFSKRVSHLYDHTQETVYLDSFTPMEMGNYKVVVTVDDQDIIREIMDNSDGKTNNVGTGFFTVGPDLQVRSKNILPSSGYVNTGSSLSAKIFNVGQTTAYFSRDFPLEVTFTTTKDNLTYLYYIEEPIFPGSYAIAKVDRVQWTSEGLSKIIVKVDDVKDIDEVADFGTYDNNNWAEKDVTIIKRVSRIDASSFSPSLLSVFACLVAVSLLGLSSKRR
ncbi:MAG: hypothetical protein QF682_10965 [Candidatus Thermoplasmatota archaeon]|nr:hypothetical protein [Candidatus Thermoplasmatota archaeon]